LESWSLLSASSSESVGATEEDLVSLLARLEEEASPSPCPPVALFFPRPPGLMGVTEIDIAIMGILG